MGPCGEELVKERFPGPIDGAHRDILGNAIPVQNNQYVALPVIHFVVYRVVFVYTYTLKSLAFRAVAPVLV